MATAQPRPPQQETQGRDPLMMFPECCKLLQPASLYVGDLDPEVTVTDLINKFSPLVPVVSARLCRCALTGNSLRYAYVNLNYRSHAIKALACLNHTHLKGKPIRIMWSQRDPSQRKSGIGNLFVKNLDLSISSGRLEGIFCHYGTVISCKVAEEYGKSKGFGFVQFDSEVSAVAARAALHDAMIEGKRIYVSKFIKKRDRTAICRELKFTNLYLKNLVEDVTEDLLHKLFSAHGKVRNVVIMRDSNGKSRGFGFVNFQSPEDAKNAVEAMNGTALGSKTLFVGRAQKKAERMDMLTCQYKEMFNWHLNKLEASNLYVGNLNESVDDNRLRAIFSYYGLVTDAKVIRNVNGTSKGFGFVCFSTPEEAKLALYVLNGAICEGKTLYVGTADGKEYEYWKVQNYHTHGSVQISCPSSHSVATSQYQPFYVRLPPCPPPYPLLHQPIVHPNSGANVGDQYGAAAQYYQPNFSSYIPLSPIGLGNIHTTGNLVHQQQPMLHATSGVNSSVMNYGNSGFQMVSVKKIRDKTKQT